MLFVVELAVSSVFVIWHIQCLILNQHPFFGLCYHHVSPPHKQNFCKTCKQCQQCKKQCLQYGYLPSAKEAKILKWKRVHIDLIRKYIIKFNSGTCTLQCLTMIDPATGWFKIKALKDKTADTVIEAFHSAWLCRYP